MGSQRFGHDWTATTWYIIPFGENFIPKYHYILKGLIIVIKYSLHRKEYLHCHSWEMYHAVQSITGLVIYELILFALFRPPLPLASFDAHILLPTTYPELLGFARQFELLVCVCSCVGLFASLWTVACWKTVLKRFPFCLLFFQES